MSQISVSVIISPDGDFIISGKLTETVLVWAQAVELWHSQPDRGLAFRFLQSPSPASLPLIKTGGDPPTARIDAAPFLAKVGFTLPDSDHRMHITTYDENRGVLSTRWEE